MRLKSLEIRGFKSFAEKTVINFDNDITGVVGPNGCGKSNVVDSIRWVLGEQKAKMLRLEKMDNIIFNGTKEKQASNFAEVSLTLDNTRNLLPTEFTSVTISRIIQRDGDSEYRLNGVTCRLKDIKDLFLDTGIGFDSYSIIELKMIDEILNDVDKARRRLIEQAAGVSKYKSRKRETMLKLDSTEADLNRVEDLLAEIEKNLKALEKQAAQARRYKKIKEEYKELSIQVAKYDLKEINDAYENIKIEIRAEEDKKLAIETTIKQMEAELLRERKLIIDKEKSLSEQQKVLNNFIATIQEKEGDKRVLEQKINFLSERLKNLHSQIELSKNLIASLENELYSSIKDHDGLDTKIQVLEVEVAEMKQKVENQRAQNLELRTNLESKRNSYLQFRQQLHEVEKNIAIKEANKESLKKNIQRNLFEKEERLKQVELLQNEVDTMDKNVRTQRSLLESLREKEEINEQNIENLTKQIDDIRQGMNVSNRALDSKNHEYKLTKNMIDSLEGFPESIKYLKKQAAWLKDAPLLSDIISSEDKYKVAIETVLQPYLNHYIVENEQQAFDSINLLHNSSKGKASFFVLDYFKKIKTKKSAEKIEGAIAIGDLIDVSDKYKMLFSFLLDQVFVVEEDQMDQISGNEQSQDNFILIAENGKILRSNFQISGGAVGLFEGKRLGRQKNLEKLDEEIKKLEEESVASKKDLQTKQNSLEQLKINSFKKVIERENYALQNLEKELVSKKSRIDNYRELVEKSHSQDAVQEQNLILIEEELAIFKTQLDRVSIDSNANKNEMDGLENLFKSASETYNRISAEFNSQHIILIQEKNKLQSLLQGQKYRETKLKETQDNLSKYNSEQSLAATELAEIKQKISVLETQLIQDYLKRDEQKSSMSDSEGDYFLQKERIDKFDENIRERGKMVHQSELNIQMKKDQLNDLKLKLNILKERFSIEFRVALDDIMDNLNLPDISKLELENQISKVRNRIDNFGDVNPMAEEAYTEMKTRYDFIIEQRDDLIKAKESLMATINEIETTAKAQFMETFTKVRENFILVFRSMFTQDDNCDLVLENENDPLESDIDIIAKPKGKRPQSINQLSGGEKTLTALSLLFGLYLYKPAPFCILDEVDAPLDDANIKKFNDAIRSFSDRSQFIIVTHNKMTMASVDAIYGVTMVQKGISRVVPVDFSNLN
ncbi:MAG: chromosome segregation protein SMC [Bacteroidetes bacterium]|nr:chromosome segregation protein SMC [Bacteroidota bacterium]